MVPRISATIKEEIMVTASCWWLRDVPEAVIGCLGMDWLQYSGKLYFYGRPCDACPVALRRF